MPTVSFKVMIVYHLRYRSHCLRLLSYVGLSTHASVPYIVLDAPEAGALRKGVYSCEDYDI
jgi:hypothetical protein